MTLGSCWSKECGENQVQQGEVLHLCALRSMSLSVAGFAALLVGASKTSNLDRLLIYLVSFFGQVDIRRYGAVQSPENKVSTLHPMTFSLAQIDQGIDALLKNASQLVAEANKLLGVSAFARAFALAHLARDELSNVTMLYAAGPRMAAGHDIDWRSLMKRLRDHKAKLRMETVENALFIIGNGLTEQGEESLSNITAVSKYRNSQ